MRQTLDEVAAEYSPPLLKRNARTDLDRSFRPMRRSETQLPNAIRRYPEVKHSSCGARIWSSGSGLIGRAWSVAAPILFVPNVSNGRRAVTPEKKKWGVTYL